METKMKFIDLALTNRKKVSIDFTDTVSMTDQSDKKSTDIRLIMQTYLRTGQLPNVKMSTPRYMDASESPASIPDALLAQKQLLKDFYALPPEVRTLCNNNPSNLPNLIANPEFREILLKHGILVKKQDVSSEKEKAHDAPTKTGDQNNEGTNS